MARRTKTSVQKRLREQKKAEKAASKREVRQRQEDGSAEPRSDVAGRDDLAGYGVIHDEADDAGEA